MIFFMSSTKTPPFHFRRAARPPLTDCKHGARCLLSRSATNWSRSILEPEQYILTLISRDAPCYPGTGNRWERLCCETLFHGWRAGKRKAWRRSVPPCCTAQVTYYTESQQERNYLLNCCSLANNCAENQFRGTFSAVPTLLHRFCIIEQPTARRSPIIC